MEVLSGVSGCIWMYVDILYNSMLSRHALGHANIHVLYTGLSLAPHTALSIGSRRLFPFGRSSKARPSCPALVPARSVSIQAIGLSLLIPNTPACDQPVHLRQTLPRHYDSVPRCWGGVPYLQGEVHAREALGRSLARGFLSADMLLGVFEEHLRLGGLESCHAHRALRRKARE